MTTHIDPVEMVALARGTVARRRRAEIQAHCRRCDDCAGQLAAVVLLRRAEESERSSWQRRRPVRAAAATIALAIGATWVGVGLGRGDGGQAASGPATPVASPSGTTLVRGGNLPGAPDLLTSLTPSLTLLRARQVHPTAQGPDADPMAVALQLAPARNYPDLVRVLGGFADTYDETGTPWLALTAAAAGHPSADAWLREVAARQFAREDSEQVTASERLALLALASRRVGEGRVWQGRALLMSAASVENKDLGAVMAVRALVPTR